MIIIPIIIRFLLLLNQYVEPLSDYGTFYNNAISLCNKKPLSNKYIATFPYLYSYILLLGNFFKIVGTKYINIIIFNIICDLIGAVFFYKTTKNMFNEKVALYSLLIWLYNPLTIIFDIICCPVIIFNTLLIISIYYFNKILSYKNDKKKFLVLSLVSSLIIGITNTFRPIMIIFIIAIFIYYIYQFIEQKKINKTLIISILIIILGFLTINKTYSLIVSKILI